MANKIAPESFGTSREELQQRLQSSPFNSWLGVRIEAIHPDRVEFTVPWRHEFTGSLQLNRAHGGVLTAIADTAAGYTLMARTGVSLSTVDLRVDFHRPASPGELRITGTLVHQGGRISCADVQIFDVSGRLVASGRGTFYTPTVEQA
jgi:uncharacterized protein (TIGR00369 family)